MTKFLKRLHGRSAPPGLEWIVLKRLPMALLVGTLVPVAMSVLVRLLPVADGADPAKSILNVDIFSLAVAVTFWTAILTVAIGCIVVTIMKGPAFVADAYPLVDASRPRDRISRDRP